MPGSCKRPAGVGWGGVTAGIPSARESHRRGLPWEKVGSHTPGSEFTLCGKRMGSLFLWGVECIWEAWHPECVGRRNVNNGG